MPKKAPRKYGGERSIAVVVQVFGHQSSTRRTAHVRIEGYPNILHLKVYSGLRELNQGDTVRLNSTDTTVIEIVRKAKRP